MSEIRLRNTLLIAPAAVLSVCLAFAILAGSSGCEKSSVPRSAAYVKNASGLMPATTPRFDPTFVSNPADAKLLPERTISYEPLDTFRAANAEKLSKPGSGGGEEAEQASKSGQRPRKGSGKKGAIGNFTSKVGGLIGDVIGKSPDYGGDETTDPADMEGAESEDEEAAEESDAEEEDASDDEATGDEEEDTDEDGDDADSEDEESGDDEESSDEESEDEESSDDDSEDEEATDESEDEDDDEDAEP